MRPERVVLAAVVILAHVPATDALTAEFPICSSVERVTCVVDGDTVWFQGTKYRFADIDTPEKGGLAECVQEGLQAIEATKRLAVILSSNAFSIEPSGTDRYGRTLARFVVGNTTAGEMLVSEVMDRGLIEDPLAGRRRPVPGQVGGHGLWLANQVCDLVQVRATPGGNVVRMHMRV